MGKTAYEIVLDSKKRTQILSITEKELDKLSGNLFQRISKFHEKMTERLDIFLYKKLYNTAATRLGHLDANDSIQEYCEGKISSFRTQEEFVERAVDGQKEAEAGDSPSTAGGLSKMENNSNNKGKCCNIF